MMTSILRDSLGGNCKTVMIANMSIDIENEEESFKKKILERANV